MTTKERPVTIRDLLEEAREDQGLSQRGAAAALGTTPTTYRAWMRGQRPGWDRVPKFVEFTGKSEVDVVLSILPTSDKPEYLRGILRTVRSAMRPNDSALAGLVPA